MWRKGKKEYEKIIDRDTDVDQFSKVCAVFDFSFCIKKVNARGKR